MRMVSFKERQPDYGWRVKWRETEMVAVAPQIYSQNIMFDFQSTVLCLKIASLLLFFYFL